LNALYAGSPTHEAKSSQHEVKKRDRPGFATANRE
jgi:hypothetical protein